MVKSHDTSKIFHIAPKRDFQRAIAKGSYRPVSLKEEGFLHCSLAHQILPVANSVFRGKKGLVLIELDPRKLTAKVRHEDLRGSGSPYPHLYGALNAEAVTAAYDLVPNADGTFSLPKEIVVSKKPETKPPATAKTETNKA